MWVVCGLKPLLMGVRRVYNLQPYNHDAINVADKMLAGCQNLCMETMKVVRA